MAWKGIVGKSFTPEEFREYVAGLSWNDWRPEFIVLHNTEIPSLSKLPNGYTRQDILDLETYYRRDCGWSSGPHLVVDDRQIWVFSPLTAPGTHANSWNPRTLGVEMLGDYRREAFNSGRGLAVQRLAVAAVAILSKTLDLAPDTLMLHKENGETEHDCPGKNVDKATFVRAVKDYLTSEPAPDFTQLSASQAGLTQTKFKSEEFGRAREYLPVFQTAADAYQWPAELEAVMQQALGPRWMTWVLMGMASRESRFGLLLDEDGRGDGGHGHGIMQVDDRSHAAFCDGEGWQDLRSSLEYVHHSVIVPSFNYLGENCFELVKEDYGALFKATVAAYNCGPGNVRKALEAGTGVDSLTTGRDYAKDVLARAEALYEALS